MVNGIRESFKITLVASTAIFIALPTVSYAASYSCPGDNVQYVNGAWNDASRTYSQNKRVGADKARYFKFKTNTSGTITLTLKRDYGWNSYDQILSIGTSCNAHDIAQSSGSSDYSKTFNVTGGTTYYIKIKEDNWSNKLRYEITFDFKTKADLMIGESSSPSPNPATVGNNVTFKMFTKNNGQSAALPDILVKFKYNMDVDISYAGATSDFSCDKTNGILSAGSYITCTKTNKWTNLSVQKGFTIKVKPQTAGTLTQTATIESQTTTDPDTSNNSVTSSVTVNNRSCPDPNCDCSADDPTDNNTQDAVIASMDGVSSDKQACISGESSHDDGDYDFYKFSVGADGNLTIKADTLNNSSFWFQVGSQHDGTEYYSAHNSTNHLIENIQLHAGDTVYFRAYGADSGVDEYRVSFDFKKANTPPVASDVTAKTMMDQAVDVNLSATDADGDSISSYQVVQAPSHGSVSISGFTATYTPNEGYYGEDSFTYKACDDKGLCSAEANATITIIGIVNNADDLCYTEVLSEGIMCIDMGICKGGLGCKNIYPLRNISDSNLTDVHAVYDETGLGGSFGSNCEVEPEGTCGTVHDIDMGPFGFFGSATEFNLTNPVEPDSSDSSIAASNFMSMSCFNGNNLYGTYVKDNVIHRGQIKPCNEIVPDEDVPDENVTPVAPICGTFEDMFQTRKECGDSSGGEIDFNNAGQTLDGSNNVIIDATDNELTTCGVSTPDWVTNQFETCGEAGDCVANNSNAQAVDINYTNPPTTADVDETVTTLTDDLVISSSNSNINAPAPAYDEVKPSNGGVTGYTVNFDITRELKVNKISTNTNSTFNFNSDSAYNLKIGKVEIASNGSGNTYDISDGKVKNIKIYSFDQSYNTQVKMYAQQTIKMNSFHVGRTGSHVVMKAPYININDFEVTNSGSNDAYVDIYANVIDIGSLKLSQNSHVKIYPYTEGRRILARFNTVEETSSSDIQISTGKYYVNSEWILPGTSDVSAIRAIDNNQDIDFIVNSGLEVGNNPGINSLGNHGNFGDLNAAHFRLYINGNLNTGGGGTTLNATIYVNGDVSLGNPTYIKGAVNANSKVDVGQGQFIYDQNISDAGWGECKPLTVSWQMGEYHTKEDTKNPMPPTKLVVPKPTLVLSHPVPYDVNVTISTKDGTALAGMDYVRISNQIVTIKAGDKNASVDTTIYNDPPIELTEDYFIKITDLQGDGDVGYGEYNTTRIVIDEQLEAPICFNDNFDSGKLDDKWRLLYSSGNFTPHLVKVGDDWRLRLTDNGNNEATAITKDYQFATKQNLIIVEFDYHAYGGCGSHQGLGNYGADGIVNVLFNSEVGDSPLPGSFGGSMGYAQKDNGDKGFEGGWLGVGVDEYGNFGNCNEGRIGGLPETSCDQGQGFNPQQHTNTVVIRGDGNGTEGYEFLAGLEVTKNPYSQKPVADKMGNDYISGLYKLVVDARDPAHLYIRMARDDTGTGNNYKTIIPEFDAKNPQYNQGDTPEFIRYAITAGTGGGCNNHELSWIKVQGNCQVYITGGEFVKGPFAALDDFRWDSVNNRLKGNSVNEQLGNRVISTKTVNEPFKIAIASIDEDGVNGKLKPGIDVKYGLFSGDGSQGYVLQALRDANFSESADGIAKIDEFRTNKAYPRVHIRIYYCGDYNGSDTILYPLSQCWDNTLSDQVNMQNAIPEESNLSKHLFYHTSDLFSIQPADYNITVTTQDGQTVNSKSGGMITLKAGNQFNVKFAASGAPGDDGSIPEALMYNEGVGSSFDVIYADTNASIGCKSGDFNNTDLTSGWGFIDGIGDVNTTYNEVGSLDLNITDENLPCKKRFAAIDCDDQNVTSYFDTDKNTTIGTASVRMNFVPGYFDIQAQLLDNHPVSGGDGFTYISNDLNNSAELNVTITAKSGKIDTASASDPTTKNYNSACYAKSVDLNTTYLFNGKERNSTNPDNSGVLNNIIFDVINAKGDTELKPVSTNSLNNGKGKLNISDINKNIFDTDNNGTGNFIVRLNFNRVINKPVNPFVLNVTDLNTSDSDGVVGKLENQDMRAVYYYARARASKFMYDDVTDNSIKTPVYIDVYYTPGTEFDKNATFDTNKFTVTNDFEWFISSQHNNTKDGEVKLVSQDTNKATVTNTPTIVNGKIQDITVTDEGKTLRPFIVDINMTGTSSWLIYNKDKPEEPSPFYRVRFTNPGSDWAGYGKTGRVVETNASKKKTKRLEW